MLLLTKRDTWYTVLENLIKVTNNCLEDIKMSFFLSLTNGIKFQEKLFKIDPDFISVQM